MDELAILIFALVIGVLIAALILPIVALVIALRTKRQIALQVASLDATQAPPSSGGASDSIDATLDRLNARIERLEALLQPPFVPRSEVAAEPARPAPTPEATAPPQASPPP